MTSAASTGLISVVGVLFLVSQFLLLDLSQVSEGTDKGIWTWLASARCFQ